MAGHCTTMPTGPAELSVRTVEGSLVADTEAVLLKVVQLVEAVVALMCTDWLWPEARVDEVRLRVWDPAEPPRAKDPEGLAVPSDQVTGVAPLPPGRLSANTTLVPSPGPALETVTV